MRMLSIKEPFATLIASGEKTIETRSWKTNYRGEIYIHASMSKPKYNEKSAQFKEIADKYEYHEGYVLCKCNLIDCQLMTPEYIEKIKKTQPNNYLLGYFAPGRYAWVLDNVTKIKPFPAKGKLGIWHYEDN